MNAEIKYTILVLGILFILMAIYTFISNKGPSGYTYIFMVIGTVCLSIALANMVELYENEEDY